MNLTPEQQAALQQLLNGPEVHADAQQDYEEICQVIEEKLSPVFAMIGEELKALRDENSELRDIVFKLVGGMHDAVGTYKRNGLRSSISETYKDDLGTLGEPYKALYDRDLTDELIEKIMGEGVGDDGRDEYVKNFLGGAREKLAKVNPSFAVSIETMAEPEAQEEQREAEEAKAVEGEQPEEGSQLDAVSALIKKMANTRKSGKI